LPAGGIAYDL